MIAGSFISFSHSIVTSPARLILAQFAASVILIGGVDWRAKAREARRQASIRQLEALFALEDPRDAGASYRETARDPGSNGAPQKL